MKPCKMERETARARAKRTTIVRETSVGMRHVRLISTPARLKLTRRSRALPLLMFFDVRPGSSEARQNGWGRDHPVV